MMNLFLLMTAYYIIKPVRESLILGGAGPEIKAYAGAAAALMFVVLVPLYGKVASRLNRLRLINGVTALFASNLVVFYELGLHNVSFGVVFFVWAGLFNLMLVAQFWAFANDVYTQEQGKRLFAIIGIGSSLGAIFGAGVAGRLFMTAGVYPMLLIAAALLGVCMVLSNWVHYRESNCVHPTENDELLKSSGGISAGVQGPLSSFDSSPDHAFERSQYHRRIHTRQISFGACQCGGCRCRGRDYDPAGIYRPVLC